MVATILSPGDMKIKIIHNILISVDMNAQLITKETIIAHHKLKIEAEIIT